MGVFLYGCSYDSRVVNKHELSLTDYGHFNIIINDEPLDLINPIIKISTNTFNPNANYFYLEETSRYYYIKTYKFMNGLVIIEGTIDVLDSYGNEILNSYETITRCGDFANPNVQFSKVPDPLRPLGPMTLDSQWLTGSVVTTSSMNNQFIITTLGGSPSANT